MPWRLLLLTLLAASPDASAEVPPIGRTREIMQSGPMSLPGGFTLAYETSKKHKKWEGILRGMQVLDQGVAKLNLEAVSLAPSG